MLSNSLKFKSMWCNNERGKTEGEDEQEREQMRTGEGEGSIRNNLGKEKVGICPTKYETSKTSVSTGL